VEAGFWVFSEERGSGAGLAMENSVSRSWLFYVVFVDDDEN